MATSKTQIANLALQHLGESQIYSIEDGSDKTSRSVAANYDQARDEVLVSARWNEARAQFSLTKLATPPLFKWAAAYQLPTDFLRLIEVEGHDAWMPKDYFGIMQGRLLLSPDGAFDEAPGTVNVEYICREEDITRYSPLLIECVALKLALKCAKTLTGSDAKVESLTRMYEQVALPKAMTIDATQRYQGSNHPLRSLFRNSLLGRARQSGW